MGLFRPDFYRFFAFGFAAGAVLVATTMGTGQVGRAVADGVVPVAQAHAAGELPASTAAAD